MVKQKKEFTIHMESLRELKVKIYLGEMNYAS